MKVSRLVLEGKVVANTLSRDGKSYISIINMESPDYPNLMLNGQEIKVPGLWHFESEIRITVEEIMKETP